MPRPRTHLQWANLSVEEYHKQVQKVHNQQWLLRKQIKACREKLERLLAEEAALKSPVPGNHPGPEGKNLPDLGKTPASPDPAENSLNESL